MRLTVSIYPQIFSPIKKETSFFLVVEFFVKVKVPTTDQPGGPCPPQNNLMPPRYFTKKISPDKFKKSFQRSKLFTCICWTFPAPIFAFYVECLINLQSERLSIDNGAPYVYNILWIKYYTLQRIGKLYCIYKIILYTAAKLL